MRHLSLTLLIYFILLSLISGQSLHPIAFDINSPLGVEVDHAGNAWVVEGGTGADDCQIWKYDAHGSGTVVVSNLPSFFNVQSQELQSALNILIDDHTLYVIQGGGPHPLSGSIMTFNLDEFDPADGPLLPEDALRVIPISSWVLANGFAESNPYSITLAEDGNIIISDAAANAIIKYTAALDELSVLAIFPPSPNPLPFGPPFVDAVPTKIMNHPSGGFLVSTLTGFPFVRGSAKIYHVTDEGEVSVYADDLTLLTDMAIDPQDNNLIALQFASFGPMGFEFGSAQLVKVYDDGSQQVMTGGFGPSAGIGIANNGDIYASHLFLGHLLQWKRCDVSAGTISTSSGSNSVSYCANDGVPDIFDVKSIGSSGMTSLVISDANSMISKIITGTRVNIEGLEAGKFQLQQIAYDSTVDGPEIGHSINDLSGCFELSYPITIEKIDCNGCHEPLNFRYSELKNGTYRIKWDRVNDAQGYQLSVGYKGVARSFVTIPTRRTSIVLTSTSTRTIVVKVNALCHLGEVSDYTKTLEIYPNSITASNRSRTSGQQFGDFFVQQEEITMGPNPASDKLIIQLKNGDPTGTINVYDIRGVLHKSENLRPLQLLHNLNISDLREGLYLITIQSENEIIAREKLVIAR